jgi:hypothetical protein
VYNICIDWYTIRKEMGGESMDPVTLILTALPAGAAASMKVSYSSTSAILESNGREQQIEQF